MPSPSETPAPFLPDAVDVHPALQAFVKTAFKLDRAGSILERPMAGTTLYVATCTLELQYGTFTVHTFQDIIHKGYILVLTYGDIFSGQPLWMRIHSSCVTSETLRGCDCDCVQQLESALATIARQGSGVLFYLLQEGRGVGYLAKSRDRMLVQATQDEISTFQAYRILGLKHDYRQYQDIIPICQLLGVAPRFIVLTNNPNKVEALKAIGAEVVSTYPLEIEPNPYNLTYLSSKAQSGHALTKPSQVHFKGILTPEPVIPFKPHALPHAQRFVYVASYFLPIKPVKNEIVLDEAAFNETFSNRPIEQFMGGIDPLIEDYAVLRGRRFLIKVNSKSIEKYGIEHTEDPFLLKLTQPYWFRVHVYTDVVTSEDFIVLSYGSPKAYDAPLVRIHSESIFNRFPSRDLGNREKFKAAVQKIVYYGAGFIVLLYNDGRGAGFGAYAQDRMLTEQGFSHSTDESYQQLGISYDRRDYDAVVTLLKQHLPRGPIQMIFHHPDNLVHKKDFIEALEHHQIHINNWVFIEEPVT